MIYLLSCNETPQCDDINSIVCESAQDNQRLSPSQWLIDTNEDSLAWINKLKSVLEQGEHRVLIVPILGRIDGWLHDSTELWLNSRLEK